MRTLAFLLSIGLSAGAAAGTAGKAGTCGGSANFAGTVIIGGFAPTTIQLEWAVWEDASVRGYWLSRYPADCDRPTRCSTKLGRVRAQSSALELKTFTFVDTAPAGVWTYRLEVLRSGGGSCFLETTIVVPSPPPCDSAALCAQVAGSFAGSVILSGAAPDVVRLQWLTHAETEAVEGYRLRRFNCAALRDCSTEVATVEATGSCGQVMVHSVTDTPPEGSWTYMLDVLDAGGRTACSLRLPAPASPASSR